MDQNQINILVCDDDKEIAGAIEIYLRNEGYHVFKAYDGIQALEIARKEMIHLIIMDIMMPKMDGVQATMKLREEKNIPIIMLSAKSEDYDKITGLNVGADDYVTKPFNPLELIARVKALLRRADVTEAADTEDYHNGALYLNPAKHIIQVNGKDVVLTLKEFQLLCYLVKNKGNVMTRDQILQEIWGYEFDGENRTVDVHIRTLRTKLGEAGSLVETVRGIGYRIGGRSV